MKALSVRVRAALDPLRARLRRAEVVSVCRALARAGIRRDATAATLSSALLDRADALARERAVACERLDQLELALSDHGPAAVGALLEDHLEFLGIDRRAVADREAVHELHARRLARVDGEREVCLVAAAALAAEEPRVDEVIDRLVAHGTDTRAPWGARVSALDGVARLIEPEPRPTEPRSRSHEEKPGSRAAEREPQRCDARRPPEGALVALESDPSPSSAPHTPSSAPHTPSSAPHTPSSTPHTPSSAPHTPSSAPHTPSSGPSPQRVHALRRQLEALVNAAGAHRWVQCAAAGALIALDPERGAAVVRDRLISPRPGVEDAIVRARLLGLLASRRIDSAAYAALVAGTVDPSELVRQAAALACRRLPGEECRSILARLTDAACEPTARVRAVGSRVLAARAAGSAGGRERRYAAVALARVVDEEPDPVARRIACVAAADACALSRLVDSHDHRTQSAITRSAGPVPSIAVHDGPVIPTPVSADPTPPTAPVADPTPPTAPAADPTPSTVSHDGSEGGPSESSSPSAILLASLLRARDSALVPPLANAVARAAERALAAVAPERAATRAALSRALVRLDEHGTAAVRLPSGVSDDLLGRALAELAQTDFGLYARRRGDRVIVRRGERVARRAWRLFHEIAHPIPSKRQGHLHTVGRVIDEPLRAHPARLAEVTRTRVPGERVYAAGEGGWANYLPLVDDLLSLDAPARLYSEHGCTTVEPPTSVAARIAARVQLTARYAELSELRLRSVDAVDAAGRRLYSDELARLGFRLDFEPWGASAPEHVRSRLPRPAAPPRLVPRPVPASAMTPLFADVFGGHDVGGVVELGAFALAATVFLAGRSIATAAEVRACRRRIPLVVGGWGTRGKSGVERLKAALFHALGYEVVCKTTGCEATILVGVPGRPLVEVPLYRPYDKATIWEQRDVLRFAGARRPHVLLWECMALNPRYVELLQRGWMRDDLATITNAYPDHEDVQGPSGLDVARTIAEFTPRGSRVITAEIEMLPVLRDQARTRGTELVAIDPDEHELIPPELLARFPYQEHPRNVALVLALAAELGIDRDVALVEMADHVLPDVGGLRTYGPVDVVGRRVRFTNGMSANERASAVANWRRCGLDSHDPEVEPQRWIVAFVNNRADRPARTLTFAECVVEDLATHRVFLCGSGVRDLARAIDRALRARLARLRPEEIDACLARRKVGAARVESALAELSAWTGAPCETDARLVDAATAALAPASQRESLAAARRAVALHESDVASALERLGVDRGRAAELARFAVDSWAVRRAVAALRRAPDLDAARGLLRELWGAALVVPDDPCAPAAEMLAAVATACPPGVVVDAMGLQNIKGPGLAVVNWFLGGDRAPPPPTAARPEPSAQRAARGAWGLIRGALDHVRSVGRRRRADRIFDELSRGRLAATTAARAISSLLDEQRR